MAVDFRIPLIAVLLLSLQPAAAVAGEPSPIRLQPGHLAMQPVLEGEKAEATLFIRNESDHFVEIVDVQTSCGCTVAEPQSRLIPAGGFTPLKVTIDTSAKLGDVKKWVRIRDADGNEATAWLTLTVKENPHLGSEGRTIFSKDCRSCHADPAAGLSSGKALYAAVCAMCHGADAKGAYAPALRGHDDADALAALIDRGTGSRQMPGFGKGQGGPLDRRQIRVLSQWLLSLD